MKKLLLITHLILLSGCNISGGMGAIDWSMPGDAGDYTCEDAGPLASSYCATGEHPHLCDCF